MGLYEDAKKESFFVLAIVAIIAFGSGWGFAEGIAKMGGQERVSVGTYVLQKDLQSQYILRTEAKQVMDDKENLSKQVDMLQNKLDRIEIKLVEYETALPKNASAQLEAKATPGPQNQFVKLSSNPIGEIQPTSSVVEPTKQKDTQLSKEKSFSKSTLATVFDPPSNVRKAPNGKILCWVNEPIEIRTYGPVTDSDGLWYNTDFCEGQKGVIHHSQIKFGQTAIPGIAPNLR